MAGGLQSLSNSPNYTGNGYKLSSQRFLGSFGKTSITYDWLMVALDTIDKLQLTLGQLNVLRNHCTHSLYPFSLKFLKWGITRGLLLLTLANRTLSNLTLENPNKEVPHTLTCYVLQQTE